MSSDGSTTLCVGCGKPFEDPTVRHRLPDGSPCLRCDERALEALPSLLPGGGFVSESEAEAEEAVDMGAQESADVESHDSADTAHPKEASASADTSENSGSSGSASSKTSFRLLPHVDQDDEAEG